MKLKQAKGAFKAGGSHRLRQSKIPAGSGTQHATPVLQHMDHIEEKIGDLHRREAAFLDQLNERFPKSATPNQLSLEECGPLERTIFMCRFRTAQIDFWAKEHPHYIEQDIAVPKLVQHILTFGKGHHLPKDTEHLEGGTVAPAAFYAEVTRLRARRQEEVAKQARNLNPNPNPNLNANLSLRKANPSPSPTLLNHPPLKESTQRKRSRGRTKRQRMRFWNIFSVCLKIWHTLCTRCMTMARVVVSNGG